jgi:hypothetical protein
VSTDPSAVLTAIDGALHDLETSEDAMRWNPEPGRVICDGGKPLVPGRWNPWRHGDWYCRITTVPPPVFTDGQIAAVREFGRSIQQFADNALKAYAQASAGFWLPFTRMAHVIDRQRDPRGHIRCRECNPAGNPPPLAASFGPGPKAARMQGRRKR